MVLPLQYSSARQSFTAYLCFSGFGLDKSEAWAVSVSGERGVEGQRCLVNRVSKCLTRSFVRCDPHTERSTRTVVAFIVAKNRFFMIYMVQTCGAPKITVLRRGQ